MIRSHGKIWRVMQVSHHEGGTDVSVLVRQPVIEQVMAWLVANGPICSTPPLPMWALSQLVKTHRILRLRRGVYVAPYPEGVMPSAEEVLQLLEPKAVISFFAALSWRGLVDLDPREVVALTAGKPLRAVYGSRRLRLLQTDRAERVAWTKEVVGRTECRIATPSQALLDCLIEPRLGPSILSLARALSTIVHTNREELGALRASVISSGSPTLARRLGFLLHVVTEKVDPVLLEHAQRNNASVQLNPAEPRKYHDSLWRIELPMQREQLREEILA